MLAKARDITRKWMHKVALALGEKNTVEPESIVTQKKLKDSLTITASHGEPKARARRPR